MGIRNSLILFFSAMAVSMVILIVFFSLFFKNFDNLITFDTRLPDTAPQLGNVFDPNKTAENSKVEGLEHATVNVPMESGNSGGQTATNAPAIEPTSGAGVPGVNLEEHNEPTPEPHAQEPHEGDEDTAKPVSHPTSSQPPSVKKPASTTTTPANSEPTVRTSPAATKPAATTGNGHHQVVLDGFSSREEANKAAEALKAKGITPIVKETKGKTVVQVGTFSNPDNARQMAEKTGGRVKQVAPAPPTPAAPPVPGE